LDNEKGDELWENSDDIGVDTFRTYDEESLNRLLHFPDGRPALFNKFRSISRKCAWDKGAEKDFVEGNPDMQPLSLLWHQRVGIASIVEKIWTKTLTDNVPGVLLADDVGVGKTAQVMGTIAFIIDAYWAQQLARGLAASCPRELDINNVRKAPILGESMQAEAAPNGSRVSHSRRVDSSTPTEANPYLAGRELISDLPHLIIVPNSLIDQWTSELRVFFAPKSIEIYVHPASEKDFQGFWEGPWKTSTMPMIHRIILMTHSVRSYIPMVPEY
jgi:SNF2 family DNA or RNA helicase